VDPLRKHDLETAKATLPSEKAGQALDLMRFGIELKWASLRARDREASDQEIERRLRAWLAGDV
jgi:hypothetical protein